MGRVGISTGNMWSGQFKMLFLQIQGKFSFHVTTQSNKPDLSNIDRKYIQVGGSIT